MSITQNYSQNGSVSTPVALSAANPQSIRAYFEKVRELVRTGNPYPVSLNDVWPLCYTEKGVAVRFLKKQFVEGYDYRSFDKKVKRGTGGTVSIEYTLSVSCMEFFIARKVREVFEVYREVFHRVADVAEQAIAAKLEMLQSAIDRMGKEQSSYFEAKVKADATKYDQDMLVRRTRIMSMISMKIRISSNLKWADWWTALEKAYGVNVLALKQEPGEHWLDTAIRHGHIDKIEELLDWQSN